MAVDEASTAPTNVLQGAFIDGRNNVLQWTCIAILAETMLLLKGWHPLPLVTNVLHSPLVQGQLILPPPNDQRTRRYCSLFSPFGIIWSQYIF